MAQANRLISSIPANNEKIVELYNKVKSGQLNPSPDFQRKLVWKKPHKIKFIETILLNFPFPEIYIAPGETDLTNLKITDLIVDGQQRVSTIISFIDEEDVFALPGVYPKFRSLPPETKKEFLNYEISIRYLKNAQKDQIVEIFQRINKTEYALNLMEKIHSQYGASEFVCFAKQLFEDDLGIDLDMINYKLPVPDRQFFIDFFINQHEIFSENDYNRMYALQFMLTILSTLLRGDYFQRNNPINDDIQTYNEEFPHAEDVKNKILSSCKLIDSFEFPNDSYWFSKANIFTLIIEMSKYEVKRIDAVSFKEHLLLIEDNYKKNKPLPSSFVVSNEELSRYFDFAREGINQKKSREERGKVIQKVIQHCLTP